MIESALAQFDQVVDLFEMWLLRAQSEVHLQQLLLAFLVGATFGWLIHAFTARKNRDKNLSSGGSKSPIRKHQDKNKEDVELRARRRL